MAIEVNGVIIPNGGNLSVNGICPEEVYVNGVRTWWCHESPGNVTDFSASDNRYNEIQITFTPTSGLPAPTYDLYRDGLLYVSNVSSGDVFNTGPGSWLFKLLAYNGQTPNTWSNEDYGNALAEPCTLEWATPGFYNWTVPSGVFSSTVCMIGGGGTGIATYNSFYVIYNGGGHSGGIVNNNMSLTPGQLVAIQVGEGGNSGAYNDTPDDGTFSSFSTFNASGGLHGTSYFDYEGDYAEYDGNGAARNTCMGTYYDGTKYTTANGSILYGGQAGFSSPPDSAYQVPVDAIRGAGGAIFDISSGGYEVYSIGNGGNGVVQAKCNSLVETSDNIILVELIPDEELSKYGILLNKYQAKFWREEADLTLIDWDISKYDWRNIYSNATKEAIRAFEERKASYGVDTENGYNRFKLKVETRRKLYVRYDSSIT